MKILLLIILILIELVSWIFATQTTVNDEANSRPAFIVKSIFYWIAIIAAFCIGGFVL